MNGLDTHPGQKELLQSLANLLGVGLTYLGGVLCPRLYHSRYNTAGARVSVGGRSAYAAFPTWPLSAVVVLAAEMAQAGKGYAFAEKVLSHPDAAPTCTPEELDQALRAVASVLLANGWVTDLRDAEEGEV